MKKVFFFFVFLGMFSCNVNELNDIPNCEPNLDPYSVSMTVLVIESTETRYVQKNVDMYRYVAVFLKRLSSGTAAPAVAIPVNY